MLYYGIPSGGQLVQFIPLTDKDWNNAGYLSAWLVSYYIEFIFIFIIFFDVEDIYGVVLRSYYCDPIERDSWCDCRYFRSDS
jgi:hypothetical protein